MTTPNKKVDVDQLQAQVDKNEKELIQLRKEFDTVMDKMARMGLIEQRVQNYVGGSVNVG